MGGKPDHPDLTRPLGILIARLGYHLLTGAGEGVMAGVSEAFFNRAPREGLVIGIIRAAPQWASEGSDPARYFPNAVNRWVEIPVYTHLQLSSGDTESRNHINVLTSDLIVALPGGSGTASEVELAIGYGTPLVFFTGAATIDGHPPRYFQNKRSGGSVSIAESLREVEAAINFHLAG